MADTRRMQVEDGSNQRSDDSMKSYPPSVTHERAEMHLASAKEETVE